MEFRAWKPEQGGCEAILLDDEKEILFHLRLPRNSIPYWQVGFLEMFKPERGRQKQCQRLLQHTNQLHECKIYEEGLLYTFLKAMCGLVKALDHVESETFAGKSSDRRALLGDAQRDVRQLLRGNQTFNFAASCSRQTDSDIYDYALDLTVDGQKLPATRSETAQLPCIPWEWWSCVLDRLKQSPPFGADALHKILREYELLREIVIQQTRCSVSSDEADVFTLRSFGGFSKALTKLLDDDQSGDYAVLRERVSLEICASIVANEHEPLEERKAYLDRVLSSREFEPEIRAERIGRLGREIQEDYSRDTGPGRLDLIAIIGILSQHYLRQYNLDRAVALWSGLRDEDPLLRGILSLYRTPEPYALAGLAWCGLFWLFSYFPHNALWLTVLNMVGGALIACAFGLALFVLGFIVWRLAIGHGLDYVDLFLPRLLGAVVVGLSVLLLESTAWEAGIHLDPLNWIVICVGVYVLSFVYIFTDVHKTRRLLPLPEQGVTVGKQQAKATKRLQRISSMRRSIAISTKIFFIGLFEAFVAVLLISSLFFTVALDPWQISALTHKGLCLVWQMGEILSLGFSPTLVLLWTGLTLFIGAFVQLLWQERQITSA